MTSWLARKRPLSLRSCVLSSTLLVKPTLRQMEGKEGRGDGERATDGERDTEWQRQNYGNKLTKKGKMDRMLLVCWTHFPNKQGNQISKSASAYTHIWAGAFTKHLPKHSQQYLLCPSVSCNMLFCTWDTQVFKGLPPPLVVFLSQIRLKTKESIIIKLDLLAYILWSHMY